MNDISGSLPWFIFLFSRRDGEFLTAIYFHILELSSLWLIILWLIGCLVASGISLQSINDCCIIFISIFYRIHLLSSLISFLSYFLFFNPLSFWISFLYLPVIYLSGSSLIISLRISHHSSRFITVVWLNLSFASLFLGIQSPVWLLPSRLNGLTPRVYYQRRFTWLIYSWVSRLVHHQS